MPPRHGPSPRRSRKRLTRSSRGILPTRRLASPGSCGRTIPRPGTLTMRPSTEARRPSTIPTTSRS
jgi:hypothetical protein